MDATAGDALLGRLVYGREGRLVHVHRVPERTAGVAIWPTWVPADIVDAYTLIYQADPRLKPILTITEIADKGGKVILDFNRAINPPCAFTIYATCPLPPGQNQLELAIPAGEKDPGLH